MKNARLLSALLLTFFACLLVPSSGLAATTAGQLAPGGTGLSCTASTGHAVSTLASAKPNPYVVPTGRGVITEWQFRAGTGGGSLALQTLSQDTTNNGTFTPLAESAVETPTATIVNQFKTRISVSGGELLGLRVVAGSPDCRFSAAPAQGLTEFSVTPAPLPGGGPVAYPSGLADLGLNVKATIEPDADNDGFGDETQDGCPTKASRSDDCVKPSVRIDKGPKAKTRKTKAKFEFSSDDAKAKFECSVDGKKFAPCASPLKVKGLKKGKHVFEVRAIDQNENASAAESYTWKVKKKRKH